MSDEAKRYNGWTNYETWCVHLWLTNNAGSYCYWSDEAAVHRGEASDHENAKQGVWSVEETARFTLADAMKESFEQFHPFRGEHLAKPREPDVYCDLLDAALSEVDWHEVAQAFLDEVEPDDEPDPEDDESDQADEGEGDSPEDFEKVKRERIENPKGPLFELGRVVSTPGALAALTRQDLEKALARHHRGDWGDVDRHDWRANEEALSGGARLLSVYRSEDAVTFWVITEADRSSTCVLLPDEY